MRPNDVRYLQGRQLKDRSSEKVPSAFSAIYLGADEQGEEALFIFVNASEGVEIRDAAAAGDVITMAEIESWFERAGKNAKLPTPKISGQFYIADNLNILRVTMDNSYCERDRQKRLENVRRALDVLRDELPWLLDNVGPFFASGVEGDTPYAITAQHNAVERLNAAVAETISSFKFPGPGKRHQSWHVRADYRATLASVLWRAAGARRLGVGKPTSPPVLFAELALQRLGDRDASGEPVAAAAIAKALSRRKKDPATFRSLKVERFAADAPGGTT